jgi:hypothetical protein
MKAIILLSALAALPYEASHEIHISPSMGFARNPVMLYADITNRVTNNTDHKITINAYYNLYVEGCGNDKHHWTVTVNPHGTWQDHWKPQKECVFRQPGNYSVEAEAIIEGVDVNIYSEKRQPTSVTIS